MKENNYKYYTCRYDAAFKEVFIQEDTSLLKAFLENVLNIRINRIEIKNSELNNDNVHIRRKLVDSIIYTDDGVFNIEVNSVLDDSVRVRNTCYLMNAYSRYFMKGENYNSDCKFIQINLNYNSSDNQLFHEFEICDKEGELLVNNFLIYHFNMDKYMEFWYNKDKEAIEKNKYLIMLDLSKEDLVTLSKKDKVVIDYMERLNTVNEDPKFQSYMSAEEDDRKMLNTYKDKAEKAYSKGIEQGIQQGMEQGIEQTKNDLCIKMYQNGYNFQSISELLKLSEVEIKNIINKK